MAYALVVIDIQNDYFPGGRMELFQAEAAAAKARQAQDLFRSRSLPVIHVRHLSARGAAFFEEGTPGADLHPLTGPLPGESIVEKRFPNSFRNTPLLDILRATNPECVFFAGMMSHMCVDATVRAAFDLGFACTVLADACATRDLTFGQTVVGAPQVHAAFMAALGQVYAELVDVEELSARFAPAG